MGEADIRLLRSRFSDPLPNERVEDLAIVIGSFSGFNRGRDDFRRIDTHMQATCRELAFQYANILGVPTFDDGEAS